MRRSSSQQWTSVEARDPTWHSWLGSHSESLFVQRSHTNAAGQTGSVYLFKYSFCYCHYPKLKFALQEKMKGLTSLWDLIGHYWKHKLINVQEPCRKLRSVKCCGGFCVCSFVVLCSQSFCNVTFLQQCIFPDWMTTAPPQQPGVQTAAEGRGCVVHCCGLWLKQISICVPQ